MKLAPAWLRRVARSRHADRLVLRGSLLTARWAPGRPAADVDHLAVPDVTVGEAEAIVREVLAEPDPEPLPEASFEVIWAETPWPGLRVRVGDLQIDVGSGDPLAAPPVPVEVLGVTLPAARPETMFAWKVHGLVELGPGRWHPKTLFDIVLIDQNVALDDELLVPSLALAFASRGNDLSELDRFLTEGAWGTSRGSRQRWRKFQERYAGPHPVPPLADVVRAVGDRVRPLVAKARARG